MIRELPLFDTTAADETWSEATSRHLAEEHGVRAGVTWPNLLLAMEHGEAHMHGTFADGTEPHIHSRLAVAP